MDRLREPPEGVAVVTVWERQAWVRRLWEENMRQKRRAARRARDGSGECRGGGGIVAGNVAGGWKFVISVINRRKCCVNVVI